MKKDIEWLRKRLYQEIGFEALNDREIGFKIAIEEAINLLNQLDEPEVLSQEWIERNVVHVRGLGDIIEAEVIENLIVPKQEIAEEQVMDWLDKNDFYDHITAETVLERAVDKGELSYYDTKYSVIKTPTIPKFVANYLEKAKEEIDLLRVFEIANGLDELDIWRKEYNWIRLYHLDFAKAWIYGYEVEEEQKYYAKLKEIKPLEKEWLTNLSGPKYYTIDTKGLMLGEFLLDLVGMKTEASAYTLKDWERHGVNDSNADFVEVGEE